MEPQVPAEGIMIHKDWGSSVMYKVACECGCDDCTHTISVEADDLVTVSLYTEQKTDFWTEVAPLKYDIDNWLLQQLDWWWKRIANGLNRRLSHTWDIWVHGYVKYSASIMMSEQQALNYGATLIKAAEQVKTFRDERIAKCAPKG